MKEEIEQLLSRVNDLKCSSAKEIEEARVALLGKKGFEERTAELNKRLEL